MEPAAAEVARRKVKRASGLLREALSSLAQLVDGQDAFGVVHAHDEQTIADARDLIALGVSRHGVVDVVVLARPIRSKPTTAADAAKEKRHATAQDQA